MTSSANCRQCGAAFEVHSGRGRPRAYCSPRCRDDAYRDRLASEIRWDEETRRQPISSADLVRETIPAIDALLDSTDGAPPPERLARAVIETRVLAHNFRRLEPDLEPSLAWRAGEIAERIDVAVDDLFPTIKEQE